MPVSRDWINTDNNTSVATALPPLKLIKGENICPKAAKTP